jgi:raffinose/stachyose/melibiose transport system permease protein
MRVSSGERFANYAILIVFAVFALYPILTIVAAALGPDDAAGGQVGPGVLGLHPENFARAWEDGHFGTYLRTSLLVSATVVVVSVVLSILSGFAFGTMRFRGSTVLFYLLLVGIMMPSEAIVVPL